MMEILHEYIEMTRTIRDVHSLAPASRYYKHLVGYSLGQLPFALMNYSVLTLFSHELLTMTFDPIKLPSYDNFSSSINQRS